MTERVPESYRPALVTMAEDTRDLTDELLAGLESEGRVLTWLQEMTIHTLGRLDWIVYSDLARQFRGDQGVMLAALVRPSERRGKNRTLSNGKARALRERFLAEYVHPAHRDAFRDLRVDATEYVDDAADETDDHNPGRQRHAAMRPALTELQQWQKKALTKLLDGFDSRADVLDWGHDLVLATHGELDRDWVSRIVREQSTLDIMLGEAETDSRARRLFAAFYVLPRYRQGVRMLAGMAGEQADTESEPAGPGEIA